MDILSSDQLQTSMLSRDNRKDLIIVSVGPISNNYKISDEKMGEFMVDILLQPLIYNLLYRCFFEGNHFFAVGSEPFRENLEWMMEELIACGV